MNNKFEKEYIAKAFVSCSLRTEDEPFVDYIERILQAYNIEPFGTVGRYSVTPENPAVLMKKNIPNADFVVICATPRYLQKDLHTGQVSYGLSEMIHIETGIAYANDKPVVVFVQEGTYVGNFIPNITQSVTLNENSDDFVKNEPKILELLNAACLLSKKITESNGLKTVRNVAIVGLAAYGAYKLGEKLFKKN